MEQMSNNALLNEAYNLGLSTGLNLFLKSLLAAAEKIGDTSVPVAVLPILIEHTIEELKRED